MRQTAQCVGRVVRSKTDYGIVILADVRFARHDKRGKLPAWVLQFLDEQNVALSTDSALHVMRKWLRQMAQPIDHRDLQQMLLDTDQVEARLKRPKFEAH
mmetsp:Transcript_5993/g.19111  ORF Transcript_5993/g.19111 Transcript_5993/m.19111 type:complete len:100 (-) Transcript_5993:255-554(-)